MLKPNTNSRSNYINPNIEDEDNDDDDDNGDGDQDKKNDDNDNEDDDPLFADDWGLAEPLFPSSLSVAAVAPSVSRKAASSGMKKLPPSPPVTLLVMAVDESIIFDPSAQELAVADGVLAVTVGYKDTDKSNIRHGSSDITISGSSSSSSSSSNSSEDSSDDGSSNTSSESNADQKSKTQTSGANPKPSDRRAVRLISVRTIDPPSRLTHSGLPNALNPATGGTAVPPAHADLVVAKERLLAEKAAAGANGDDGSAGKGDHEGVWTPPRGGLSRKVVKRMVDEVIRRGGVGEEVLEALEGVVVGGGVGES